MTTKEHRTVLTLLRTKTAGVASEAKSKTLGELVGSVRRGAGHVWDAANVGAQSAARHLESKKAPKILVGAVHAAPVAGAAYGAYKALQGLSGWNNERVLRNQMGG